MKTYIVLLLILSSCTGDTDPVPYHHQHERCDPPDRIGCVCKDGTRVDDETETACDQNGGFDRWICKWGN